MRINARLTEQESEYLTQIQKANGFKHVSDALKFSLKNTANQLKAQETPGIKMKRFLKSGYVGAFEIDIKQIGDYKSDLSKSLSDKHDIV